MYQSPFGLSRRPFSSTPDPTCVVPVGGMPEAISELEHCAQDGQGLGILTAPAGLGKTILCRKLAESLRSQFAVVFLPNANFPTRRSLLQAMLYEMGHPYLRLGEQELRLEFTTAVRDLHPDRDGLVVIVDEAHLLHNRLLEELRTATHIVHQGEMLVRVILSGQLELEERLVKKDLAAINQRIVCHVTLSSLSMLESQEYLEQRVEWAGGALSDIFAADAVRMICQASDGNPRCLNQLADHALLLASAGKHAQVQTTHVLEALEELKQLPLHWNHVELPKPKTGNSSRIVEIVSESLEVSGDDTEDGETACIEFGAPCEAEQTETPEAVSMEDGEDSDCIEFFADQSVDDTASDEGTVEEVIEISANSEIETTDAFETETTAVDIKMDTAHDFTEEVVMDHYSQLEKGLPAAIVQPTPRDWVNWDPVEELRNEEAAFAAPPFPRDEPDITIINAIPEPGAEWQPEELNLPRHQPVTADPSELIDRVMPLIDAALHGGDFAEYEDLWEADLQTRFLKDLKEITPEVIAADSIGEPFLTEASLTGDWEPIDTCDEIALLMNQQIPMDIGHASEESQEYVLYPQGGSSEIEAQIAQLVLDTYNEVQPLIWNSTTETEKESEVEPPPIAPGEEPIRDPGDSTPFDELRDVLQQAVEAAIPPKTEPIEPPRPSAPASEEQGAKPRRTPIEYDIVLPEAEEESSASSRENTNSESRDNRPLQRPHSTRNLFSKLRRKDQA